MKNSNCTCLLSMKYICEPFLIYNHRRPLTLSCKLQMEINWEIKTYLFCSWICCGSKVKWKLFSRMQKECSFNFAFALSQHSQLSNQPCLFLSSNPTVSLTQMNCYNKTGKKATWAKQFAIFPPRFSHLFPPPMMQRWCGRIIIVPRLALLLLIAELADGLVCVTKDKSVLTKQKCCGFLGFSCFSWLNLHLQPKF